jgi:hypothetical protein
MQTLILFLILCAVAPRLALALGKFVAFIAALVVALVILGAANHH